MKVVLANSLGKDKRGRLVIHSPSRWTQTVSNPAHWFAYYPWELAYLSSLLKKHTDHHVKLVDGCLARLDQKTYVEHIAEERPDILIIESASRVVEENLQLAQEIKRRLGPKIIFVGQHATAFAGSLHAQGIDYVVCGEYERAILALLTGKDPQHISGVYPQPLHELLDVNQLPWPEDADVSRFSYAIPGEPSSRYAEIQMYASRGCPESCNFCVARNVYYQRPNWRPRQIRDIVNEIVFLKKKYPRMQGVFFDEEEHNVSTEFVLKLADALVQAGLHSLKYEAMCNIRYCNHEMLAAMKKAGYYKLRIGIETFHREGLKQCGKNIDSRQIVPLLEMIKMYDLEIHGTFMMGMPHVVREDDIATLHMMDELIRKKYLDSVQISLCTPQPGTPLYAMARERGWLITEDMTRYDGGGSAVISYPGYSAKDLEKMYQYAFSIRDHAFLLRYLNSKKEFWTWIQRIKAKYGLWGLVYKGIKRMQREIHFFTHRFLGIALKERV